MKTLALTEVEHSRTKKAKKEDDLDRDFLKNLIKSLEDAKHGRIRRVA